MAIEFKVHNVAHSIHNRGARSALPANPRMKQHIGATQMRVLPGRPVLLSREQFEACLPELRDKAAAHILEVRTLDGRKVDLETLVADTARAVPPLLNKRLDSVANDKPAGIIMPPHLGEDGALPQVLPAGAKPALLQEEPPVAPVEPPLIPPPAGFQEIDEAAIAGTTGDTVPEKPSYSNKKNRR